MQEKNFEEFIGKNSGKDVVVTVKNPNKRVITGELLYNEGNVVVRTSSYEKGQPKTDMVKIDHTNVKTMSVVMTKKERNRIKTERRNRTVAA